MPALSKSVQATLPRLGSGLVAICLTAGCTAFPEIPITTPEPIRVNIEMRVDVHQTGAETPSQIAEIQEREREDIIERQIQRSGEIQEMKNNRLIGENHRGLLTILQKPAGTWGDYVSETVDAENADRMALMRIEAEDSGQRLEQVQKQRAALKIDQSFKGEWVEVLNEKTGGYRWVQVEREPEGVDVPENPEGGNE